jgi:hypothetical protein
MKKLHIKIETMKQKIRLTGLAPILLAVLLVCFGCSTKETPEFNSEIINNIPWRSIGPGKYGGRISDIEVVQKDFLTVYISASTGGVFKSTDTCRSWEPVFDYVGESLSVGDMAVAESNANIIWVGTGEASGEQSSASIGDGVYKSTDGGKTWEHMGG